MNSSIAKILIVEDDPFLSKIMSNHLSKGFEVDRAGNGARALNKMKTNEYSLVLLDLVMPEKNGFTVLEELKMMNNKTPVLVFSNLSQNREKKRALDLGAKGYFVKSDMDITEVMDVVKHAIKLNNQEEE